MSDAIVVGGGILGVSVAWRLAQTGRTVRLLEAGQLGGGASHASFAWLNARNKSPEAYHRLNVDGLMEYRRLGEELGRTPWLHFDGTTEWDDSAGGGERLRERVAALRRWAYPVELLPIQELRSLEPQLMAPPAVEEFAYFPADGYIDPILMIGAVADAARRAGAVIETGTRVIELVQTGNRITGVKTAAGDRLSADIVVVCAGRWSADLLQSAGLELPLAPRMGLVAISAPAPVLLRSVHNDDVMKIRPDGAGRIMMRHDDFDAMLTADTPVSPIPAWLDQLFERVVRVLPGLAGSQLETLRISIRPVPSDHQAVVGYVPERAGLYLIVTHSAVTLGPLLARLACREINCGDPDVRLQPFRPDRLVRSCTAFSA